MNYCSESFPNYELLYQERGYCNAKHVDTAMPNTFQTVANIFMHCTHKTLLQTHHCQHVHFVAGMILVGSPMNTESSTCPTLSINVILYAGLNIPGQAAQEARADCYAG